MEISVEDNENTRILNVSGRVTMQTAHQLHGAIKDALKNGVARIIVNLVEVSYMDSSGVGVLVSGSKLAREKETPLGLAGAAERVMLVMKMTGLDVIFRFFPSLQVAMAELD